MDYDDSEFQNQSFHLVGEENNKFPSSLQSFALPKIDIDEHLQVHLRFDTDVLLGIQGQDNNWIEDFSSGTTAIEFSSTAAESCSISRHNNVWSEATSSESVEMLLKSVVEDEMTDRNMEAVAHDGLIDEKDKRDGTLKQGDDHSSKMGDTGQNDPSLPPDKCMSNLTMVDEVTIGVQTPVEGSDVQKSSDCITCTSAQDYSSSSLGNLSVGPEEFHIPVPSDQVVEEDTRISMTERSDFLSNDGLKESQVSKRDEVNEQYPRGQEVMRRLSSGKDSSFLDPIMDSMVPMDQECNKSGYSENPDVFLEAIAYPVKALNKDTEASERSSIHAKDMCSLVKEGDTSIGPQTLKVGDEHVPVLSHLGEDSEDVCYKPSDPCSKVEYLRAELPTHTANNRGEEPLDSYIEVTGGEESPERHLTKNSSIGDASKMALEVHATSPVDFETQINEVKDVNGLDNFKSQAPEPAVVEKHFEDEAAKKPEAGVNVSDAHMPADLSHVDVKITSPIADDLDGRDKLVPSTCPEVTSGNSAGGVFTKKAEDGSSSGKNAHTTSVLTDTVAKMTDESVLGHAEVDVELVPLKKDTNIQQSHPVVSKHVVEVLEQKGKGIDAHLPNEPVAITDPVVTSSSHPKGELYNESGTKVASLDHQDISAVEQNEEANSSPLASELVQSHEKEIIFSASACLSHPEGNLLTQLSSRPVAKPTNDDHSPLDSTTESQTIIDGQSSSYVDKVDPSCQNEPRSLINKPISQENTVGIEGALVVNDSASNVKDACVSRTVFTPVDKEIAVNITVRLASNDEGQTFLETPSSEKNSSGDAQNYFTKVSSAFPLSRSDAEDHLVEANSSKPSSMEPNCGSPTVISCSEHVEDEEGSRVTLDRPGTASNNAPQNSSETGGNIDKVLSKAEDDRSFTFEVGSLADLSKKNPGIEWKPFPSMQTSELPKISKEKSHGSRTESKEGKQHGVRRKTPNADKTTRVTVSSNESLTTPKVKSAKGTSIVKKPGDKDARSCSVTSTSVGTVSRDMQLEESRQRKGNEMKTSCSPIVQTSGLPDLNSSVAATTLFYQPFTDLQQVQLRAQIFVYGSLIQGVLPDEACMVSAFGGTDRGRSSWEAVWRLSLEKYQNQKSPFVNSETKHPRSAVRVPEQVSRCSSLQSRVSNTSASQSGGKVVPSVLQNSTPLPSPVWSTSTNDVLIPNMPRGMHLDFNQASSPLQSYYSSQTRQFANNSTPWLSQAPCNGPRGVPIQGSTLNAVTQYSTVPVVETVIVTPVRDSSMPRAPNIQLVTPGALLPTSCPLSVTAVTGVKNETQRKTASPGTNKNASISQKPRKRKKAAGADDLTSTIPVSQSTTEPGSTAIAEIVPPASADLVSSSRMPKVASGNLVTTTPNIFPAPYQIVSNNTTEQRAIFSEETSSRIEQAKLQAEDAASLAAASVRHSQGIWSQLAAQRDSGLASEVEVKLASAAVAAAAAASVAKAAAAAAKVASDAALQAKMMADELATKENLTQIPESGSDTGKNLGRLTPDSVLKGKDKIDGSSSVISAAREAARRRVEAASAAAKRAENIDAIVKAAELAAEAVSQAGAIIAMGDPLPFRLSELIDAGPEAFRKLLQTGTEKVNTKNLLGAEDMVLNHSDHHDRVVKRSNENPLNNKGIQKTGTEYRVSNSEQSGTLAGNYQGELVNSLTVQNDRHQRDQLSTSPMESDIQQGSLVEVVSDDDGLRGAWFSARVLDLKDNKAHVCYDNLLTDKGSEKLKEWVSLDGEGNTAPRIRIAHPMTTSKHEGTRKRRREAVGNYVWAIGDHVDAWMRDGWWEGIVTEKIQGDETKLTLHFPAGGDSSVVRAWNLRPSLVWKDGQWTEWMRARENTLSPYEGDTPKEKRPKLGSSEANFDTEFDGRGIRKLSKKIPLEDPGNPEESRPLNLSAKDRVFYVGRNAREERISDALKVKRTGLQKEGSRVVFGVPKPGKKRKFMEVSKHYVTDNKIDKTSEGNDSLKFAKYLMPQQSRPWKSTSKVEPKGKQAGEFSKTRGIKSVKSQTIQTRSTSEKDTSSLSTTSVSNRGDSSHGALHNLRAGISEKTTLEKNPVEVVSFPSSLGTSANLSLDSHMQALPGLPAAKKKSTTAVEGDSGAKGKSTCSVVKPTRSEDKGENSVKEMSDSIEPRRSNRKIQPTSRLLEGLQSSLVISKIPSFSHDRGARSKHRGSSRG